MAATDPRPLLRFSKTAAHPRRSQLVRFKGAEAARAADPPTPALPGTPSHEDLHALVTSWEPDVQSAFFLALDALFTDAAGNDVEDRLLAQLSRGVSTASEALNWQAFDSTLTAELGAALTGATLLSLTDAYLRFGKAFGQMVAVSKAELRWIFTKAEEAGGPQEGDFAWTVHKPVTGKGAGTWSYTGEKKQMGAALPHKKWVFHEHPAPQAMLGKAAAATPIGGPKSPAPGISMSFNLINEKAAQAAKQLVARQVTLISDETKQGIRDVIHAGITQGFPPKVMAQQIRAQVGLNAPQQQALTKWMAGAADAAVKAGKVPNWQQITEQAKPYVEKLVRQRAYMIARTETVRASSMGQQAIWDQALEQGLLQEGTVKKRWIPASSGVCNRCIALGDDPPVPVKGTFEHGLMGPPAHPNCRCATGLVFTYPKAPEGGYALPEPEPPPAPEYVSPSEQAMADFKAGKASAQELWKTLMDEGLSPEEGLGVMAKTAYGLGTDAGMTHDETLSFLAKVTGVKPAAVAEAAEVAPPTPTPEEQVLAQVAAGNATLVEGYAQLRGLGLTGDAAQEALWQLAQEHDWGFTSADFVDHLHEQQEQKVQEIAVEIFNSSDQVTPMSLAIYQHRLQNEAGLTADQAFAETIKTGFTYLKTANGWTYQKTVSAIADQLQVTLAAVEKAAPEVAPTGTAKLLEDFKDGQLTPLELWLHLTDFTIGGLTPQAALDEMAVAGVGDGTPQGVLDGLKSAGVKFTAPETIGIHKSLYGDSQLPQLYQQLLDLGATPENAIHLIGGAFGIQADDVWKKLTAQSNGALKKPVPEPTTVDEAIEQFAFGDIPAKELYAKLVKILGSDPAACKYLIEEGPKMTAEYVAGIAGLPPDVVKGWLAPAAPKGVPIWDGNASVGEWLKSNGLEELALKFHGGGLDFAIQKMTGDLYAGKAMPLARRELAFARMWNAYHDPASTWSANFQPLKKAVAWFETNVPKGQPAAAIPPESAKLLELQHLMEDWKGGKAGGLTVEQFLQKALPLAEGDSEAFYNIVGKGLIDVYMGISPNPVKVVQVVTSKFAAALPSADPTMIADKLWTLVPGGKPADAIKGPSSPAELSTVVPGHAPVTWQDLVDAHNASIAGGISPGSSLDHLASGFQLPKDQIEKAIEMAGGQIQMKITPPGAPPAAAAPEALTPEQQAQAVHKLTPEQQQAISTYLQTMQSLKEAAGPGGYIPWSPTQNAQHELFSHFNKDNVGDWIKPVVDALVRTGNSPSAAKSSVTYYAPGPYLPKPEISAAFNAAKAAEKAALKAAIAAQKAAAKAAGVKTTPASAGGPDLGPKPPPAVADGTVKYTGKHSPNKAANGVWLEMPSDKAGQKKWVFKDTTPGAATGPTAPAAAAVEAPKPTGPASAIPTDYAAFSGMDKIAGPSGSQAGQWYRDPVSGATFYVKPAQSPAHAYNEVGGTLAYQALGAVAGVNVPHVAVLTDSFGKRYIVSQKLPDAEVHGADWWKANADSRHEAQQLFAVDALLSHWDVVGANFDNLLADANGHPIRIEAGGSMLFRAMGSAKPEFSPTAPWADLWTMRGKTSPDGKTVPNAQLKTVFGDLSDQQVGEQLVKLQKSVDLEQLRARFTELGMPMDEQQQILATLKHRLDSIPQLLTQLKYDPAKAAPEPAPAAAAAGAAPAVTAVPKVDELPDLFSTGKANGVRGQSVAYDSKDVEDLDVRFTRVRRGTEDGFEARFKLTQAAKNQLYQRLSAGQPGWTSSGGRLDGVGKVITADGYTVTNAAGADPLRQFQGDTYTKQMPWGEIRFHKAGSGAKAIDGTVQVWVRNAALNEQAMQDVAGELGIKAGYPSEAEIREMKASRLLYVLEPQAKTAADRTAALERIKQTWGVTPDDVEMRIGTNGRVEFRAPQSLADQLIAQTGVEAFVHNGADVSVLLDHHQALMSTTARWMEGISKTGMSSSADMGTGGADYVFTRQVRYSAIRGGSYGTTLVYDAKAALRRLDWFSYTHDSYGRVGTTEYNARTWRALGTNTNLGGQETMFKHRLGWEDLEYVLTDDPIGTIRKMRAAGVVDIAGRPLEEVVVKHGTPLAPRGAAKVATIGAEPLQPVAWAAVQGPSGQYLPQGLDADHQVTVPKGAQPTIPAELQGKGEWVGPSVAGGLYTWKWNPKLEGGSSTTVQGNPVVVQVGSGTGGYTAYAYTPSPSEAPVAILPGYGEWKFVKTTPTGHKWCWFPK